MMKEWIKTIVKECLEEQEKKSKFLQYFEDALHKTAQTIIEEFKSNSKMKEWATIKNIIESKKYPVTSSSIRNAIFYRKKNMFPKFTKKEGGKLLVNIPLFENWLEHKSSTQKKYNSIKKEKENKTVKISEKV